MKNNSALKIAAIVGAVLLALAILKFASGGKPGVSAPTPNSAGVHQGPDAGTRQSLTVAFLPVTCHLTCPVTDFASKTTTTGTRFDSQRFTEFPPIAEALKSGRISGNVYDRAAGDETAGAGRSRENLLPGPPGRLNGHGRERQPRQKPARSGRENDGDPQPVQQSKPRAA